MPRKSWSLLAFAVVTTIVATAQSKADLGQRNTLVGTWKLQVRESKSDPGPLPRSEVRTYSEDVQGRMKLSLEGIDADGHTFTYGYVARFDGKDNPMPGTGTRNGGDTVSITRIDPYTVAAVVKKAGEVVNKTRLVVSKDGKSLTITETGTNQRGKETHGVRVYRRE